MPLDETPVGPVEKRQPRPDPAIIGSTGLRHFGGVVVEEFLKELSGPRGMRTYREMADNDPTVGAMLFAITMLMRGADWSVQAKEDADDKAGAEEMADLVDGMLFKDMQSPWSKVVNEACSMMVYGFAPMEIIWKKRVGPDETDRGKRSLFSDNMIAPADIVLRAQPTITMWDIDPETDEITGMRQQPYTKPAVVIPMEKMLLFRTTEERNNPEGRSILRSAYRPWYYKKRIEEIEAVGVERDLAGLPVGRMPLQFFQPDMDPQDKLVYDAYCRMVQEVKRDQREGLVLPSARDASGNFIYDFELLSTGGTRSFDTSKVIQRYDRQIATVTLADFIFLGQQAVGSFALSSDKTALFATAIGGFMRLIQDQINRQLIPRIWRYNGLDVELMPTVLAGDIERQNMVEVANYIATLSAAGMPIFPDPAVENILRKLASLPPAPEGADMGIPGDIGMPGFPGPRAQEELDQQVDEAGQ